MRNPTFRTVTDQGSLPLSSNPLETMVQAALPFAEATPLSAEIDGPASEHLASLSPRLRQFLDYWQAKRPAGGGVPRRREISPLEIPDLLPYLVIVECCAGPQGRNRYIWRLAGTAIRDRLGVELTGKQLTEVFPAPAAQAMAQRFDAIRDSGEAHYLRQYSRKPDRNFLPFHRLKAPLSSDGARIDMLLGCLCWDLD